MSVSAIKAGFVAMEPSKAAVLAVLARKGLAELRRDGHPTDHRLVALVAGLEAAVESSVGTQMAEVGRPVSAVPSECVLTVADIVARTGRSERTVRRWFTEGRWPSARQITGGQWVVNEEDLVDA